MFCKKSGYISEWPENLIEEILEKTVEEPLTGWQIDGLEWILGNLNKRTGDMIRYKFKDGLTLEEISGIFGVGKERVRQIIARGIRLMRHPSRTVYLLKDYKTVTADYEAELARLTQEIGEREVELDRLVKKIAELSEKAETLEPAASRAQNAALRLPIIDMDLSARAYNSLIRCGMDTIEDVVKRWGEDELHGIRNCGAVSREEIRRKLISFGVLN